jgi:hypothetical protein
MKNQNSFSRCRYCGSFIPEGWSRCGRCGSDRTRKSSGGKWVALFLVLAVLAAGYFNRDVLLSLLPDIGRSRSPEIQAEQYVKPSQRPTEADLGAANTQPKDQSNPVGGSKIQPNKEQLYSLIHQALRDCEESLRLPGRDYDSEALFEIIKEIVMDDPLILFYEGCTYRSDGLLILNYAKLPEESLHAAEAVAGRVKEILSEIISPGMSDYEKELAIHDYLINHCRYDRESLGQGEIPPESHSAYGALVMGTAVCEGYAKAAKLLLDGAGIENTIVIGDSKGVSHAWNLVKIQGEYYHLDTTWDDPILEDGGETLKYTYFNLTDNEIRKDHQWETSDYPAAQGTRFNYYVYNDLVVDTAEELVVQMVSLAGNGRAPVTLRINGYSTQAFPITDCIEEAAIRLGSRSITYSIDEEYGVVDVWFKY